MSEPGAPRARRMFTLAEAAYYVNASVTTFEEMVADGRMPAPLVSTNPKERKRGNIVSRRGFNGTTKVLWDKAELDERIDQLRAERDGAAHELADVA